MTGTISQEEKGEDISGEAKHFSKARGENFCKSEALRSAQFPKRDIFAKRCYLFPQSFSPILLSKVRQMMLQSSHLTHETLERRFQLGSCLSICSFLLFFINKVESSISPGLQQRVKCTERSGTFSRSQNESAGKKSQNK